jgi:hypothetical protein
MGTIPGGYKATARNSGNTSDPHDTVATSSINFGEHRAVFFMTD